MEVKYLFSLLYLLPIIQSRTQIGLEKFNIASSAMTQNKSSIFATNLLELTSKTTYYMLTKSNQTITTLYNQNSQQTLVLKFVSAYL